jgi:hypothetical protein
MHPKLRLRKRPEKAPAVEVTPEKVGEIFEAMTQLYSGMGLNVHMLAEHRDKLVSSPEILDLFRRVAVQQPSAEEMHGIGVELAGIVDELLPKPEPVVALPLHLFEGAEFVPPPPVTCGVCNGELKAGCVGDIYVESGGRRARIDVCLVAGKDEDEGGPCWAGYVCPVCALEQFLRAYVEQQNKESEAA